MMATVRSGGWGFGDEVVLVGEERDGGSTGDDSLSDRAEGDSDLQHRLLGWHLNSEQLAFLADIGAEVDADEYG